MPPSRSGPARPGHRFLSQRKRWERKGREAPPTLDPPIRGLMAAVGCTGRAKTGRALPPAPLALLLQALPRLGRHASGLPCKPWEWLRCTNLARRAAVGALPPKYRGGCCGWETARQGCRALHRRPKLRIVRFRASPKAHSLRWASSPHGDHSVESPRGPQFLRPSRAGGALQRKPPGRAGTSLFQPVEDHLGHLDAGGAGLG